MKDNFLYNIIYTVFNKPKNEPEQTIHQINQDYQRGG